MQKETNEDEEDKLWSEEKDVLVIKSKKPRYPIRILCQQGLRLKIPHIFHSPSAVDWLLSSFVDCSCR